MNKNVKNRIEWVDCAKGLAIILVVYGHALTYFSPNFDSIVHVVYSFHMPLFFVLTGYVSAYSYNSEDFFAFYKKKNITLMKPYFLYAVLLLAFKGLKNCLSGNILSGENINCIINTILITRKSFISELWFLPCLLIAHCLMFFIAKRKTISSWMIVILCFGVALLLRMMFNIALPCNLDNALLALPFIFGGVQWRIVAKDNKNNLSVIGIFILALIVFTGINFVEISHGYSVDYFADIIIGNVPFFIFTATTGTAVIILCSQFVTGCKNRFIKNSLMKCGRSSLSIYGLHYVVLAIVYQMLKMFRSEAMGGQLILIIIETGIVVALILLSKELLTSCNKLRGEKKQ